MPAEILRLTGAELEKLRAFRKNDTVMFCFHAAERAESHKNGEMFSRRAQVFAFRPPIDFAAEVDGKQIAVAVKYAITCEACMGEAKENGDLPPYARGIWNGERFTFTKIEGR